MQELHPFDFQRWLIGDFPTWFLLEVGIRTIIFYALLQVVLRLRGDRLAAQMTIIELAVILTVGGVVVTPMLFPNIGILPVILILSLVLLFQWGMSQITQRHKKAEAVATGEAVMLLEEGRLLLKAMEKIEISHQRMNSVLRLHGIIHLGELKRVYAEPCGDFSIYRARKEIPGLFVIPELDKKFYSTNSICQDHWACIHCGFVKKLAKSPLRSVPLAIATNGLRRSTPPLTSTNSPPQNKRMTFSNS